MSDKIVTADVCVIGAGLGGLAAAGYLARAGYKVIVLEHCAIPGGYAQEFRRGHFRFEVALHAMDGVAPGGWVYPVLEDLGVLDQVEFSRLDPFYTARFPEHEITVPADLNAYTAELKRQFPEEAAGIESLIAAMLRAARDVRTFSRLKSRGEKISTMDIVEKFPDMAKAMTYTWQAFMDEHVANRTFQGVFSVLWGYYGLAPSRLVAGLFILAWESYHVHGAWYPKGGSHAISRAIERTIKAQGGEFYYRQNVNSIVIEDGRAVAVETEKGMRVEAGLVISNASPKATMLDFVGREHLDEAYIAEIDTDVPALSNLVVYLGLNTDLKANGWNHHEYFIAEEYDIDEDYAHTVSGNFAKVGMVITHYTPVDPGCAPEGCSILMVMCLAPWDLKNQWGTGGNLNRYSHNRRYRAIKEAAADHLIERAAQHIPGLREAIVKKEIATPLTNVKYSMNPGGSIYGGEQTVENSFRGRRKPTTPIPNLFLTGAWVGGGGMSTALGSGRTTAAIARRVLEDAGNKV